MKKPMMPYEPCPGEPLQGGLESLAGALTAGLSAAEALHAAAIPVIGDPVTHVKVLMKRPAFAARVTQWRNHRARQTARFISWKLGEDFNGAS